ncbi:MFS transporter [Paenibacillus daejeonensis]|uniref:MFS transporter n=1 Tax=Paenibacillus daejeonensis TaxID=135193 RepID=UPI00037746E8|nr:MFS transporter [Paenibacillus daejeonensis]
MTSNQSLPAPPRPGIVLFLLCAAFFMVVTDSTSTFTALPSIEADLDFRAGAVQWVITAYSLTFGGLLLLGGRLSDLVGRRRMFLTGVCLFVSASFLCGFAWSYQILIAARAMQGIAGALMTPAALSILMTTFPEGPARNRALGVWGSLGGIGATAGLLISGPVTEWLGWEWIFFINVPIGVVVFAMSVFSIGQQQQATVKRVFDLAGALTVTIALFVLVYTIYAIPSVGWTSLKSIGLLAVSCLLFTLFLLIQSRSRDPLIPLRIFRSRTLIGGNLVGMASIMSVDGMLYTFTLFAQRELGYTAVRFGLTMTLMTVVSVAGVYAGQYLTTRLGFRKVAGGGTSLIAGGALLLSYAASGQPIDIVIYTGLILFGLGMGLAFVAAQIAALTGVADRDAGLASGIEETSTSIGSALSVAIVAAITVASLGRIGEAAPDSVTTIGLYQPAFMTVAIFAMLGLLAAVILLGQPRKEPALDVL